MTARVYVNLLEGKMEILEDSFLRHLLVSTLAGV
jgi:hypothetical protein